MHPVVIMCYEKSPAINKAVEIFKDEGLDVRVLNTKTARLVEFLGALAGEDDEPPKEPEAPKDEAPKEEPEAPKDDAPKADDKIRKEPPPADDPHPEWSKFSEELFIVVDGERVKVELTEGLNELTPNGLMVGKKTAYALNETHFSFWPGDTQNLEHDVQVQLGDLAKFVTVRVTEAGETPLLKLDRGVFEELQTANALTIPRN
jgi:hypothetical protein